MAEEKNKKGEHGTNSKSVGMKDAGGEIIGFIIILLIVSIVISNLSGGGGVSVLWENMKDGLIAFMHENAIGIFLGKLLFGLKFLGTYISLLFFVGIIVVYRKLTVVNLASIKRYKPLEGDIIPQEKKVNQKWKKVEEHLSSVNPSDWRLAIIEADIILEEMMDRKGFTGQTLGEKLKNADKGNFSTLDKAWEAHKIRNLITHEGADFQISEREAKRVIGLFKETLEEFSFI